MHCIYLDANENLDLVNKEIVGTIEMKRCQKIKEIIDKDKKKVHRRILSNPKEKSEYSSKCPTALKNIIQEANQKFEVSIIDSKKLFKFCSEIVNKVSTKLPEVHSPRVHTSFNIENKINMEKLENFQKLNLLTNVFCKINLNDENESKELASNHQNLSSRVLDKEECQTSYKLINEKKIRNKIKRTQINKHMLFTFNPLKLRLKSPVACPEKLLI